MRVFQNKSHATDAAQAVREATEGWDTENYPLDIVFAFASTKQNPDEVAQQLKERFPETLVVGCTTTGEISGGAHQNGALAVAGVHSPLVKWHAVRCEGLADFNDDSAQSIGKELFKGLGTNVEDFDPTEYFCLTFIDGLSMREEVISAALAGAIEGVRLVGGSAGDDLQFKETKVFYDGEAKSDSAVFVMGHSKQPFELIKHQHFTTTPRAVTITKVDTPARRVYEMDGYPAIQAYAAALGVTPEEVTSELSFMNPMTFSCNGQIYVRSVQKVEDDGSIVFYCGVEEGMVLEVGGHEAMTEALDRDFKKIKEKIGKAEFMIGWNCILRALEAGNEGHNERIAELFNETSESSIGFDTYGEQLDGLHINQTLVALAFQPAPEAGVEG